ncbi:MAG: DEAD/DEAH box helicase [Gammaproteobacteria bacterium]|nr:DEAD/DEAH box helicase [Gammaproteobacteria bacterium]
MKILHGIWVPANNNEFVRPGAFYLWAETLQKIRKKPVRKRHPFHLSGDEWPGFLEQELGLSPPPPHLLRNYIDTCSCALPGADGRPLPSPELARYHTEEVDTAALQQWDLDCYRLEFPVKQISDIHFQVSYRASEIRLGSDFMFWYWFTQNLKQLLYKDHYIPALLYRQPPPPPRRRKLPPYELYSGWQWASQQYENLLNQAAEYMPAACAPGMEGGYEAESLLRHCSECLLNEIVRHTALPAVFQKKIEDTLLADCMDASVDAWETGAGLETYRQWQTWRQQVSGAFTETNFILGFQLREAPPDDTDNWQVDFLVVFKHDPSLRLSLSDYWARSKREKQKLKRQLGKDFERHLLVNLGHAARMAPKIWLGLETAEPAAMQLSLDDAFEFLKESAWVLEDAGFKVIVPAWWTPKGRQRVKIRLRSSGGQKLSGPGANKSYFEIGNLIQYSYELAMGDQTITPAEWEMLIQAKAPLIQFRGQWVELDQENMRQMLEFWHEHGQETPEMSIQELLQKTAEQDSLFAVDPQDALADMLSGLRDSNRLEPVEDPALLKAELRAYQKRGVAWLNYLEQLGLNGCLADDMGLGKTMQVIARLILEREAQADVSPTLLIAPTSVIGNWQKEMQKFAPHLTALIHHGPAREQEAKAFKKQASRQDMVITSYTLARKDEKLLSAQEWQRVVLDEAQNIKNPKTAQTKAILKLKSKHRLALTGTPVENRLMDLWSIFHFLNPGYLGTQARFRKSFELPVQRDNNPLKTTMLKRLVEPFILRRLKTDKNIIKDLPDKVEAKQYCNLSKEQASLYEVVVRDVQQQLEEKEGIERQGLMLSTLMKLKQICNHPAQFLQDNSDFTPERSHKLERLTEMLEEVVSEGDSALIFSQFTEIGANLTRYLKETCRYSTYYLHGGISRNKREKMISAFQDPQTEPSVFVLSVKAGGVGITLTKANHVFHFDRWWNPAVEDQATDRAFRIGQEKSVFAHKFVTLGTLEERIDQMIEDKKAIAGAIVGGDESWLAKLDNQRFKELIALNKEMVME